MSDISLGFLLLLYCLLFVGRSMGWCSYVVWRRAGIDQDILTEAIGSFTMDGDIPRTDPPLASAQGIKGKVTP